MSQKAEDGDQHGGVVLESGLETLRQSPEFRGPGDPPDDHDHANDHLALLYEDRDEQFAAALPFIRQGLERGERCLYVTDDNSREEVLAAMRSYDIDVDAALESGALSVLTPSETYRRTGEFDRDTMLEFWERSLERTRDEEGYAGLRAAAEMTWALDGETGSDELVEYEAVLNPLYRDEDYTVLCQYNRERFSAEVIHDVIKTHPHLVINNTVSRNFYYTPPEQFFDSEDLETKVDRMTQTLQEHTAAKTESHEYREFLRKLHEVTADSDRSFDEKLQAVFELGCDRLDLEYGGIARIDPESDLFEVEIINEEHDHLVPGERYPLSETYCRLVTDDGNTAAVSDPVSEGFEGKLCYETFGVQAYLGSHLEFESGVDRTFFFASNQPREESFSAIERTFHHLMGQWVQYELERRQREQELRERTEHLDALIETTPECIKTVAPDGTLLQMNPAGLEMVEADAAEDVVGECVYDLIAPADRERFREFNERVCRGESGTLEFDIIGLDGTRRHMETHAAPLHRPDGTTGQVALTRDVTEKKERAAELRESKNQLQALIDVLPVAVFVAEEDGEIVEWNDAAEEIWGGEVAESESVAEYAEYDGWWADTGEPVEPDEWALARALRGEEVTDPDEIEIEGFDGKRRAVLNHGMPVRDADGEVSRAVVTLVDITERKEREAELRQSNDRLKQFAYAASHDLQEPLRMVSSYLQLLESQYEDDLDEDAQEFIDFAVDGADRMRAMVDDLLAFSRVERADGEFEPVDCNAVIDKVTDDLTVKIEEADAEIDVGSLPTIQADSEQLIQVFSNLISNAIKYSGDGPPKIEITVEERANQWEFAVADNGIGIDPDKTDRIFEVFKRLHNDNEYPGTGIGLSLCQEIIENHGGDIWVKSEPGEGSTFFFTVPK